MSSCKTRVYYCSSCKVKGLFGVLVTGRPVGRPTVLISFVKMAAYISLKIILNK